MKTKKSVWKKIGMVSVDSGTLMLIDPCYATDFTDEDYEEFVVDKCNEKSVQVPFRKGHAGRAVLFHSCIGDGCYDVFAKFEVLKDWGERTTEVKIKLI